MSSQTDKLSGKAKQLGGKVTDDKDLQAEGKLQELKGKAKDIVENVKDKVSEKTGKS